MTPAGEFAQFVEDVVPFEELRDDSTRGSRSSSFATIAERVPVSVERFEGNPYIGGLLLAGAAALALLLPSGATTEDGFWRVGETAGAQLLAVGGAVALPLALVAAAVLLAAGLANAPNRDVLGRLSNISFFVGIGALAGVGLMWFLFAGLMLANLFVLGLIIVAYIVGATAVFVLAISFLIGMLGG